MNQMMPPPAVGTRSGTWVWNGTQWCCDPDDVPSPCPPSFPCGPFFPPPAGQPPWFPGANGGVTFSPTAPPNAMPGHFWWDGTTLHMFDGAQWVVVGGGATTINTFALHQSSDLTIPVNTWSIVPWLGSPTIDTQGAWSTVNRALTPTKAGIYNFMARVNESAVTAGALGVVILKNDPGIYTSAVPVVAGMVIGSATQVSGLIAADGMVQMNGTSDYVRVWAFSTSGTLLYPGPVAGLEAFLMP